MMNEWLMRMLSLIILRVSNCLNLSSIALYICLCTKPSMTSTSVECVEGSIFVVPPSKRSQSPIVFGRARLRRSVVTDSSSDLKPPQFSHYARSTQHMMRKMGYNLQRGSGLNFEKWRRDFLRISCRKWYKQITMIKHTEGWDMLHLHSYIVSIRRQ